jgi:hypothetical protein
VTRNNLTFSFGPFLNQVLAVSLQRNFSHGAVYVSYSFTGGC